LEPQHADAREGCASALAARDSGCDEKHRGDAAFARKDWAAAEAHYGAALLAYGSRTCGDNDDARAVLLSNRSAARCALGKAAEALSDAEECLRLRPGWAKAHSRRGAALLLGGDCHKAAAAYVEVLRLDPGGTGAPAARAGADACSRALRGCEAKGTADAAFKRGDYVVACQAYDVALAACPGDPVLHSNRSACHAKLGAWEEALRDGQAALQARPDWPRAWTRAAAAMHGGGHAEAAYRLCCEGLAGPVARSTEVASARDAALAAFTAGDTAACRARAQRAASAAASGSCSVRVFCTSDLHVDTHGNLGWCERLSDTAFQGDVLVVAGDVGDTLNAVRRGLKALKGKFRRVFFTPGNHDLWVRPDLEKYPDSICKLMALMDACDALGVDAQPAMIGTSLCVAPLFSWYHCSFDEADPQPGALLYDKFCSFPGGPHSAWRTLLALNERHVARLCSAAAPRAAVTITASHFLPRAELPCAFGVPELLKNVGCKHIDMQLAQLRSDVHVYGHTHLNGDGGAGLRYECDATGTLQATGTHNETRYVQSALEGGARGLYCVFDKGALTGRYYSSEGHPI